MQAGAAVARGLGRLQLERKVPVVGHDATGARLPVLLVLLGLVW